MIEKHYTLPRAADLLDVSRRTLSRWIQDGRVKAVRIHGRYRIAESELRRLTT